MDGFEIRKIPGKGWSLIATKTFAADDTILEEEPYVSAQFSWNMAHGYLACNHCMRPLESIKENVQRLTNNKTIIVTHLEYDPTAQWIDQMTQCMRCKVRYCSEDCRQEALRRYHRSECMGNFRTDDTHPVNILNDVWKKSHYPPETGTIMILVRLMALFQQTTDKNTFLDTLKSFQSELINEDRLLHHKLLGVDFEVHLRNLFAAFCNAFSSEEFLMFREFNTFKTLMGIIGMNSQGIATSVLSEYDKKLTKLPKTDEDTKQMNKYLNNLYKEVGKFAGEFLNNEGAGLYAVQSKINHSCTPNAQTTFPYSNDIVVLKARENINVGDEICISYLDECMLSRSRHSRQKELKENYIFICTCSLCELQKNDPDETSEDDDDLDEDDDDEDNDVSMEDDEDMED